MLQADQAAGLSVRQRSALKAAIQAVAAGLGVGSAAGAGSLPAAAGAVAGATTAGDAGAAAGLGVGSEAGAGLLPATAGPGACRHGPSGAAGAGAAAHPQPQPQPAAAADAVLALMEVFSDGSKSFVAPLVIISPDGLAATARHTVVWEDGRIHPRRLWVADGVELRHVASFPKLDVSLLRLTRRPDRGSGSSSCGSGSSSNSSCGSGSSGDGAVVPTGDSWPFLKIAPKSYFKPDARLTVLSFPGVAQRLGLTECGPLITHGRLAHCSDEQLVCVADYMGFPGLSGGAVTCGGKFMGTHIEAISHDDRDDGTSQPDVAATDRAPLCERGRELEEFDEPVERPAAAAATIAAGGPTAVAEGTAAQEAELTGAAAVGALTARADALEVNEAHKGALSLFTPWHVVEVGLKLAGIPPPQSGQAKVMSALEMAAALAGGGGRNRKRLRGR
ncbi:hypothetical protein HYH02_013874 [Chlamydomonas schloesseri]|uniref:Uncharacterized protein n=1 Tax=Chlamydomonas schloesseri TaxID=2026947 RepID=A0A835VUQ2_9CHLO|nr:hypothetical protein HYH02_013874 [Chlamydomonas schloesseri]|eukprot:KAG2430047.1 hypothetical protein HYH02_013874 [Chlamydomonas schloesseri]